MQLSAEPAGAAPASYFKYEIVDYPEGFACPAGWSTAADGRTYYYSSGATPPSFALPGSAGLWGKYKFRLTINNGDPGSTGLPAAQFVDDSTGLYLLQAEGVEDTAFLEGAEFDAIRPNAVAAMKRNWRLLVAALGGSAGTPSLGDNSVTFAKMQDIGVGVIGNDAGTADPKLITIGSGLAFSGGALVVSSLPLGSFANIAADKLLGRDAAGSGPPTEIGLTGGLEFDGSNSIRVADGGISAAKLATDAVTTIKIANSNVTLAKIENLAAARILGNNTGGAAAPIALTATQVTAMLDVVSSGAKGLAPASGGGTVNFLRADNTWAPPPGGGSSAGLRYAFDSSTTTSADPGAGDFRLNNATLASVTAIAISDTDSDAANNEALLLTWDDSTTTAHRGTITIRKISDPATFAVYDITGASTNSAGWVQFVVTYVTGGGTFTNTDACAVQFSRTGDAGASGSAGAAGLAGVKYNFASSTTITTDPSAGNFRLNHATLASVTGAAIADTDADGGNNEAFLLAQDDSTTTAHRGYVVFRKIAAPSTFAIYDITGASTDSAGWVQLALTHISSNGTFSASDACSVQFSRTGDTPAIGTTPVVVESTTARTLVIGDAGAFVHCTNASATTVTVPPNASVAFTVGTSIVICQGGAGQVTLAPGSGVTLNTPQTLKTRRQYSVVTITKVATNEWVVRGDLYCIIGVELTDANQTLSLAGGDKYAQVVDLTANRSKQLSKVGAADGRVIAIRRYTTAAFTLTITDSTGTQIHQFASGETGVFYARFSATADEFVHGSHEAL